MRGRYEEAMNIQEIEIANLDQRYGHLRLAGRTALNALADSIERFVDGSKIARRSKSRVAMLRKCSSVTLLHFFKKPSEFKVWMLT